jgi:hypothetical protein
MPSAVGAPVLKSGCPVRGDFGVSDNGWLGGWVGQLPPSGPGPIASPQDVFSTLTPAQQAWVRSALNIIDTNIKHDTGTACASWGDPGVNLPGAITCFQNWINGAAASNAPELAGMPAIFPLRTDGVFDARSLQALQALSSSGPLAADFPQKFPGGPPVPVPTPAPAPAAKAGLSTGAIVGISAAGVAVLGGVIYAATRGGGGGGGKRRKRRR